MATPLHYRGSYQARARRVRAAAYADPRTRCRRCGRTLADHPNQRNGRAPTWHAGHVIDGDPRSPLAPEVSTCNSVAGARDANQRRKAESEPLRTSRSWL